MAWTPKICVVWISISRPKIKAVSKLIFSGACKTQKAKTTKRKSGTQGELPQGKIFNINPANRVKKGPDKELNFDDENCISHLVSLIYFLRPQIQ